MRILGFVLIVITFILLTILTQIGGVLYLLSLLTHNYIDRKWKSKLVQAGLKFISFLFIYSSATFFIIPQVAKPFGRVSLPFTQTESLRPLNFLTCFLNRQYVRPELRRTAMEVAQEMNNHYPGTIVNYLDAGFPFFNGFPLVPHLSHNDGKRLDLAFCYIDNKTGKQTNKVPSPIGYGISEEPRANEVSTADICDEKGYWQYSFIMKIMPQENKQYYTFDSVRTKQLVNFFITKPEIGKIFIEPHLRKRLELNSDKIRFHGCQAVRHDDHIHIQLK